MKILALDIATKPAETVVSAFIPVVPQPWRRAGKNGKRHYTDAKSDAYRKTIAWHMKSQLGSFKCTTQPVRLDLEFRFPIPKSWPKYKRENPPRHTSRPDKDNLEKGVMDALNGIVWKDDAQIDVGETKKMYAQDFGILISITTEEEHGE
ncbi:RusA family crossover junction endodeoxyribonuclease [Sneathiella glossodoripedis]|uniref:RusA family crossover junction endodeoxyribonuclease n=1 Tax=Sneathiella glossodoripedis TaxID=418853 RepID=UPI000470C547|nr:RusA family crossover junction endodeoxyribonuclease [Sneathiella glossodoripedis]